MYVIADLNFEKITDLLLAGHKEVVVQYNNALFTYEYNMTSCVWNGGMVSSNTPLSPESLSHLLSEASDASWAIVQKSKKVS